MRWATVLIGVLILAAVPAAAAPRGVSLLLIDSDTVLASRALEGLEAPTDVEVRFFTAADLEQDPDARAFVRTSALLLVDVMMEPLSRFVRDLVDPARVPVYALRGSRDDEALEAQGFRFDPGIGAYFDHLSVKNVRNMVLRTIHETLNS